MPTTKKEKQMFEEMIEALKEPEPLPSSTIGNLVGAFLAIAIGTAVLSQVAKNMEEAGI